MPTLEELVAECLERLEDEGLPAIDAMCRAHPDQAQEILKRLMRLGEMGMLSTRIAPWMQKSR